RPADAPGLPDTTPPASAPPQCLAASGQSVSISQFPLAPCRRWLGLPRRGGPPGKKRQKSPSRSGWEASGGVARLQPTPDDQIDSECPMQQDAKRTDANPRIQWLRFGRLPLGLPDVENQSCR